jgi:hypothetical protein
MHTDEAFNSVFDQLFSVADILVVENGFNGDLSGKWEDAYNQLSRREQTPEQLRKRSGYEQAVFTDRDFYEKIQDRIYDQGGKTVCFEHSPLTRQDLKRWQEAFKSFNLHGKLRSVMVRYGGLLQMIAGDQRKLRETSPGLFDRAVCFIQQRHMKCSCPRERLWNIKRLVVYNRSATRMPEKRHHPSTNSIVLWRHQYATQHLASRTVQ